MLGTAVQFNFSAIILIAACALSTGASAEYARSKKVLREFVKLRACPATGLHRLPCPGWHMDHIIPLCAGGADSAENLQWLTREDHKAKTRIDVRECRRLKQ